MDLNWLRDFECLSRSQNFTRAADERNITQSAFSRRIKALESWVGMPLINRATYPVQLTEAGLQFLPIATRREPIHPVFGPAHYFGALSGRADRDAPKGYLGHADACHFGFAQHLLRTSGGRRRPCWDRIVAFIPRETSFCCCNSINRHLIMQMLRGTNQYSINIFLFE